MRQPPRHIAVVRFSAMGDVAMLFPVLCAVLAQNDIKITLFTRPVFAPIFSSIKGLEVIGVDLKKTYKGPLGLWALAREIRALKPDHFLDLHDVLRTKIIRGYLGLMRLTTSTFDKGRAEKNKRVNAFDPASPWLISTHERYAKGFRALGLKVDLENLSLHSDLGVHSDSTIEHGPGLSQEALTFIQSLKTQSARLIGFAPFAAYPGKTYPLDLSEKLCQTLTEQGHQILLFGAPGYEAQQLSALAEHQSNVHALAGKWTFAHELEIIGALDLMIAMDSGNGHLAANFGIPVVTLWGATHPSLGFMPFGQEIERQLYADRGQYPELPTSVYGNKLPQGYSDLMRSISVAQIAAKVEEVLA